MVKINVIRFWSLFCWIVVVYTPFYAQKSTKQKPLLISEQGSFAVGGTVITNAGTFDPYKPTPEGQTFSFPKLGKPHLMGEKGIKLFFYAEIFQCI